jgi:hypothetical protein
MLEAPGTFWAAHSIVELRTKRSGGPDHARVDGGLTSTRRAMPSLL